MYSYKPFLECFFDQVPNKLSSLVRSSLVVFKGQPPYAPYTVTWATGHKFRQAAGRPLSRLSQRSTMFAAAY